MSIRIFIAGYVNNVKSIFLQNRAFWRLILATGMSHEFESWDNCQTRLYFLSCSAPTIMFLQFSAYFTHVAFWRVASYESLARSNHKNPLNAHTLEFLHTLSHTTLTLFSPKYRVSNISCNYKQIWHGIEPTHDWINSTLQLILRNLSRDALSFHSSSLYINKIYQECFVLYL